MLNIKAFFTSVKNFFKPVVAVFAVLKCRKNFVMKKSKKPFNTVKKTENSSCNGCGVCKSVCLSENAINIEKNNDVVKMKFDISKCIFCGNCVKCCPAKAIEFSSEKELAADDKSLLIKEFEWK